ncbi:hypothetical protein D6C86_10004 [Aureobasidium pullulans]|uniref:F-box domain-containing protein n=1 Tax=Aureobasidium pullulans TaxID=5580 RepID=A0A4S9PF90_AURPU|nr:hypothetical protein D6C94_10054 [Aureobasidium pullulans]THZ53044.1 hypothetical protein D6C86_10004 [Aureobasidium pullulans]THZ83381.1 hypothetical protein D6C88_05938 [Aureobasidium pullulans]
MDTLPPELKQRICSYLKPKDLKSFRLTSTDYAAAASRYLLPRIFLLNHPDSFQEVRDIANHPELSQQVTTLVIDVCRLKQYPRYDHWARIFAAPSPASTGNQGSVEARAITTGDIDARSERILRRQKNQEQWKSYQILASAQVKKSTEKLMLECIALAFQKCPKLRNLIIDFESAVGDGCGLLKNNRIACGLIEKRNHFYRDIFSSPATRTGFAHRFYWDHIRFDLWDILKPVHDVDRALESLAVLDSINGDAIARFVLRQSGTLQSFTLGHMGMLSPSSTMWTSLAARLKGQLPHLKRLKLIDLTKPLVFDPTTGFPHPVEFLTTDDILQDHEHELQTEPMELENGLWEDYELRFFPQ